MSRNAIKIPALFIFAVMLLHGCASSDTTGGAGQSLGPTTWTQGNWSNGKGKGAYDQYSAVNGIDTSVPGNLTLLPIEGWFNLNWKYRKEIVLTNSSDELTDYQVSIEVAYEDHMNPDFSDLRFIDQNGLELKYWFEEKNESLSATVWVKFESVPHGEGTSFMYYGNPSAEDKGDGKATFIFFDDFETFEGWADYGSGSVEQDDEQYYDGNYSGKKIKNSDPNGAYKDIGVELGRDVILEFYVYRHSNYKGGSADRIGLIDGDGNGYGWIYNHGTAELGVDKRTGYAGTPSGYVPAKDMKDKWVFGRLTIKSDGGIAAQRYIDGTIDGDTSVVDQSYNAFTRAYIFGGYHYQVDQIKIRKYAASPPQYSIGQEEARYPSYGTLTSSIFYAGIPQGVLWGKATYDSSGSGIEVKVRTSDDPNMEGAFSFENCPAVESGTDMSDNGCAKDGHRHIQYMLTMHSTDAETPTFGSISFDFEPIAVNEDEEVEDGEEAIGANAGPDLIIGAGKSVVLNGASSAGKGLLYNWAIVTGLGTIDDPVSPTPRYTSSEGSRSYDVKIMLTVRTRGGQRSTDEMSVHVMTPVKGTTLDTPLAAMTFSGVPIYENILSIEGVTSIELKIADSVIQIPYESPDYTLSVTQADRLIIGTPDMDDSVGAAYFLNEPSDELPSTINILDAPTYTIGLPDLAIQQSSSATDSVGPDIQMIAVHGKQAGDKLGMYIASGDLDRNGIEETVVSAPGLASHGGAYIFHSSTQVVGIIIGSEEYNVYSAIIDDILSGAYADLIFGPNNFAINYNLSRSVSFEPKSVPFISILDGSSNLSGVTVLADDVISVRIGTGGWCKGMATGDADGDGHHDLLVSSDDGKVLIFHGPLDKDKNLSIEDADFLITGGNDGDDFGRVIAVGDVNGDGANDVVISSPSYGGEDQGALHIVFGTAAAENPADISSSPNIMTILGPSAFDQLGDDMILADTDGNGTDEIYAVIGKTKTYKLDMMADSSEEGGGEDGTEGEDKTSTGASGGCSISQRGCASRHVIWIMIACAAIVVARRTKACHFPS